MRQWQHRFLCMRHIENEETGNNMSKKAEEILLFLQKQIPKKCKILYTRFIKLRVVKERRIL